MIRFVGDLKKNLNPHVHHPHHEPLDQLQGSFHHVQNQNVSDFNLECVLETEVSKCHVVQGIGCAGYAV